MNTIEPGDSQREVQAVSRVWMLLLIVAAAIAAGIGANALPVAVRDLGSVLPPLAGKLDFAYGAFGVGYGLALIASGFVAAMVGTRRTLLGLGALGAGAMALTAAAWWPLLLVPARFVLGIAAGGVLPVAAAVFAAWVPAQERGWPMGVICAAPFCGGALAAPMMTGAGMLGSWRLAFLALALLGGFWLAACRRWFQMSPHGQGEGAEKPPVYWRGAAGSLAVPLALMFAQGWGIGLCQFWLPAYLLATWHFDLQFSSLVSEAAIGAGIAGSLFGGWATDRLFGASGNIKIARQLIVIFGFLVAILGLVLRPTGIEIWPVAISLGAAMFGLQAAIVPLWVLPLDVAPDHAAPMASILGLGVILSRLLSPMGLVGLIGYWLPSYFIGLALLALAAVGAWWLRADRPLPVGVPPSDGATDYETDPTGEAEQDMTEHLAGDLTEDFNP